MLLNQIESHIKQQQSMLKYAGLNMCPKKPVTTFSTITLTVSVRLQ